MNLEKIVPPLDLCKLIPEGEFEDSALAWMLNKIFGKKMWLIVENCPGRIAYRRKLGCEIYPAPTLAEIRRELRNLLIVIIEGAITVSCKINPEDTIYETARDDNDVSAAALRIWLKLKGIEVKNDLL